MIDRPFLEDDVRGADLALPVAAPARLQDAGQLLLALDLHDRLGRPEPATRVMKNKHSNPN
jgi:hypothetical protein